ncbi:hypothetical protein PG997_006137 [Apiospora hydei]|uniref:F-box domain-containing protein n=1 Tax=Apiospora hydei TaxID=1337664 RepID=A0ABR1WMU8_9PEZI
MERLPQEIVCEIASYLPIRHEDGLVRPALATLSRSWQSAIEPLTFKLLQITSDDLQDFYSAFANIPRRGFLRELHLDIFLPLYSRLDCTKYETARDRAANSHVVTYHVSALLQELSQWLASGKLSLGIAMYSLMDGATQNNFGQDHYNIGFGERQDLFSKRYSNSYIHLADTFTVVAPCVTSLYVHSGARSLDAASLVTLTAAFPNLERIDWPCQDPAYFLALRRQQMHGFANAVNSFQPPSACKTLCISINSPWYPHKDRLPNLQSGSTSFCSALCTMLGRSNIERLEYEGPIDSTLFWAPGSPGAEDTSWKSLRGMRVRFGLGSLAGQWFFKGRPEDRLYVQSSDVPLPQDTAGIFPSGYYDNDQENEEAAALAKSMEIPEDEFGFVVEGCEFRCIPRDEAMLPLLKVVARQLTHTPSLRNVHLEAVLPWDNGMWFFEYLAPAEESDYDVYVDCEGKRCDDPLSRARVFLHAPDWRPDEGVVAMLRGIGKACHGEDAIMTLLPFLY